MVKLKLFAVARDKVGRSELELELPPGATVGDLRAALAKERPELATLLPRVLFAIDSEYASDAAIVPSDGEVAMIPPVSGG